MAILEVIKVDIILLQRTQYLPRGPLYLVLELRHIPFNANMMVVAALAHVQQTIVTHPIHALEQHLPAGLMKRYGTEKGVSYDV